MKSKGSTAPIVVGGEAVELYTQGNYTTGDIDIKAPFDALAEVLSEWGFKGFEGTKRIWFNKDLVLGVDWVGYTLDEGAEAERRVTEVMVGSESVRIISIEDLAVDRLCAAKFWKDADSGMWAKILVEIGLSNNDFDSGYFLLQSRTAGVEDFAATLMDGLGKGNTNGPEL
jgi:hypothetical protein